MCYPFCDPSCLLLSLNTHLTPNHLQICCTSHITVTHTPAPLPPNTILSAGGPRLPLTPPLHRRSHPVRPTSPLLPVFAHTQTTLCLCYSNTLHPITPLTPSYPSSAPSYDSPLYPLISITVSGASKFALPWISAAAIASWPFPAAQCNGVQRSYMCGGR